MKKRKAAERRTSNCESDCESWLPKDEMNEVMQDLSDISLNSTGDEESGSSTMDECENGNAPSKKNGKKKKKKAKRDRRNNKLAKETEMVLSSSIWILSFLSGKNACT